MKQWMQAWFVAVLVLVQASGAVQAALLSNLKLDGRLQTRSFGINNELSSSSLPASDFRGETRVRLLVGSRFDLLDHVGARVTLSKNNRLMGQGAESAHTAVLTAVRVQEAHVRIPDVFDRADLTIGRQFYGRPNDLIVYFGPGNDDLLSVAALDIFRADGKLGDWASVTGIAGKPVESTTVSATSPAADRTNTDTDLWGGEVWSDRIIPKGKLATYFYYNRAKNAGPGGHNALNVTGVRAAGDLVAGFSYAAEAAFNGGRNKGPAATSSYTGSAYLVGLTHEHTCPIGDGALKAQFGWGRGNDPSTAGNEAFTPINSDLRFGEIVGKHGANLRIPIPTGAGLTATTPGLTNLLTWNVGSSLTPAIWDRKLGLGVHYYHFQWQKRPINPLTGTTFVSKQLGQELDLKASWRHSENVSFSTSYAWFWPGKAFTEAPVSGAATTATNRTTRYGADLEIKF
ncbi:MAG: alginate export family protein [Elusimicrobia bacterium]|nr:alginate export family protein [Elusimicrobiota bacterium]